MPLIPPSVIGTAAPIIADAYSHAELNALFMSARFPGDPPDGNKNHKCLMWLRRANSELHDPLRAFAQLVAEFMDTERDERRVPWLPEPAEKPADPRDRIHAALAKEGLSYQRGGYILGASLTGPSKSLADRIRMEGIEAAQVEYDRAYKTVEEDPAAALTAACAILESVCKCYLESVGEPLPNKQVLGNLWPLVAMRLGLSPKDIVDDDLKRILQGLFSIADGVAALRTHQGSAHGRGAKVYKPAPRHARLAVHSAHTMAMFVLETWEARRQSELRASSA